MPDMIREVLVEQKMIYEERIANIIAERDDARREVCELKSRNFERVITPQGYAELRKWDCFKEKTND